MRGAARRSERSSSVWMLAAHPAAHPNPSLKPVIAGRRACYTTFHCFAVNSRLFLSQLHPLILWPPLMFVLRCRGATACALLLPTLLPLSMLAN